MASVVSITDAGGLIFTPNQFRGAAASAPSDPKDGWTYINDSDNYLYMYAGGQWWQIYAVTPTGAVTYRVLMENSDNFALESGDIMRTE